jgi:hypothetical protein
VRGTGRGGSSTRDPEGYVERKALVRASLSIGAPLWNLEGGSCTGDFERQMKVMWKRLWRRASLSTGVLLGNLEEGSFTRDFERWMKGAVSGASLSGGAL